MATFCGCFVWREGRRVYLPQVSVSTHATIFSSTFRTVLSQRFVNPNKDANLEEANYTFPLFDGVSVVGFSCQVAGRTIKGVVKEREQAKKDYDAAKEKDQFAGLLQSSQQASDVFMTSLGNVPAGATVSVEITYLGELKHDAEVDGLRYTVPSKIAPRYGTGETLQGAHNVSAASMNITVDAEMPSAIKSIQSPSHGVSVNIGTTSTEPDAEPTFKRASASLALSSATLEKDFILQIIADDLGQPSAIMETHPSLPNHQALMTTLVPKFGLPPIKPEIVFLCDRSGSMGGRMEDLKSALQIFLKSIPAGAKFNICSFGSSFQFLWKKSASYSESTLNEALAHVAKFEADFGGTEIHGAMKEAFARRWRDIELEVIMLTDGQIWDQEELFGLIKSEVSASAGQVRVFTLGVGSGASTALIEGAARAGNGASQSVSDGEKMDKKVVRTLKASLSPHITDHTLEIKYEKSDGDDDDGFEVIEKVMADVSIDTDSTMTDMTEESETKRSAPVSLYDPSYKDDTTIPEPPSVKDKFKHLPAVPPPSYLQAPHKITQLFAYNRSTVYVLMSEANTGRKAKSVVLRGNCKQGPLALEIEIQHLKDKGETIHQLAARKAVQDLESDGGWLTEARATSGKLLKEEKESMFSEMVQREAVRLGVKYQVSGKWCSFVAIDESSGEEKAQPPLQAPESAYAAPTVRFGGAPAPAPMGRVLYRFAAARKASPSPQMSGFALAAAPPPPPAPALASAPAPGFARHAYEHSATMDSYEPSSPVEAYLSDDDRAGPMEVDNDDESSEDDSVMAKPEQLSQSPERKKASFGQGQSTSPSDMLHRLVSLQSFAGSWEWTGELEEMLKAEGKKVAGLEWPRCADDETRGRVSATVCVILFFRTRLAADKETWELVVDKAESYLQETTGATIEELVNIAGQGYRVSEETED